MVRVEFTWNFYKAHLKKFGFYFGAVDGIFGQQTLDAVYYFQSQFGLPVDGVVGRATWRKLEPYINGRVGRIVPTDMSYPYEIMMMNLDALRVKYPIVKVGYYAESVMGKRIPFVRIGEGEEEIFYSASMHANEWINSVVMMKFIEDFGEAYNQNGELFGRNVREIFNNRTLYIVPMVNPDGVDLVLNNIPRNSGFYKGAVEISNDYPSIPFPSGWKANIRGFDFEKYQLVKCSNHLHLRAFLEIEMLLFFRFSIRVTTVSMFDIKIVEKV